MDNSYIIELFKMKKILFIVTISIFSTGIAFAENNYFFKDCKISNAVMGSYLINFEKSVIEVQLKRSDGVVQNFSDKIKLIEKEKIISEKIKSEKEDELYYQYFLSSKNKSVLKLEFKKQSDAELDIFKLHSKRISYCADVKADWNKRKIEKEKADKEQKEILKAQEKLKKEEEGLFLCQSESYKEWTNCKGTFVAETGHKYVGIFKNGQIFKGVSLYPGGAKYIGEFKNFKPNGYGTFLWTNGDKYYGSWKDGKNNGDGTKIWINGRKYLGNFKDDLLHGQGTMFYPDGKKYEGEFLNGKRHGTGTFTYPDGSAYIGKFISGKEQGVGDCVSPEGLSVKCKGKTDTQAKDFTGKDTKKISIIAKKWVRISQYEANSKKGKKIMDKLKNDFETKSAEVCLPKSHNVLEKKIEVLEIDETPAYGLETKLKIGINGTIECK